MKSIVIWDQGRCGMGMGMSSPLGSFLPVFVRIQRSQVLIYSSMNVAISSQKNHCLRVARVLSLLK